MSRFRVITPDAAGSEMSMAEAIRAQAEKIIAQQPVAVLFAWETADGLAWESVPASSMLERGMVDEMHETLHPVWMIEE